MAETTVDTHVKKVFDKAIVAIIDYYNGVIEEEEALIAGLQKCLEIERGKNRAARAGGSSSDSDHGGAPPESRG